MGIKRLATIMSIMMMIFFTVGCEKDMAGEQELTTLSIGLMPAVDTAPILIAKKRVTLKN